MLKSAYVNQVGPYANASNVTSLLTCVSIFEKSRAQGDWSCHQAVIWVAAVYYTLLICAAIAFNLTVIAIVG